MPLWSQGTRNMFSMDNISNDKPSHGSMSLLGEIALYYETVQLVYVPKMVCIMDYGDIPR